MKFFRVNHKPNLVVFDQVIHDQNSVMQSNFTESGLIEIWIWSSRPRSKSVRFRL